MNQQHQLINGKFNMYLEIIQAQFLCGCPSCSAELETAARQYPGFPDGLPCRFKEILRQRLGMKSLAFEN